uniref:Uncharacterized protein n=1 Tax=Noccaea caerulescens TaxID=107243 RepID=A0A1J3DJJ5_NOCCA
MLTQDRDEELVLFLEIRRLEKGSDICKSSTATMSSQRYPLRRTAADNFLYSEDEKSDYDWLVTPPGSPSKSLMNQVDANPMALKSLLENSREEERDNISSKNKKNGLKRPSSSSSARSTSRPSTPTRGFRTTPTSRATLISSSTSSSRVTSRHSTPTRRPSSSSGTSRATLTAARAILSSSTRSSRTTSRPSTPATRPSSSGTSRANLTTSHATTLTAQQTTSTRSNSRPMSAPNTKAGSRSSTPTHRPPTPTGSSTVLRSKPAKPAPSHTLRTRPWEPYEMPGFSLEAPSNLRTTLPDRSQTASSRRTIAFGTSSSRSASIERTVARRQSCSPSRDRAPIGNADGAVPSLRGRRAKTSNDDDGLISPVAMGDQMAERAVNMRKFAPPRLTENRGRGDGGGSTAGKSSSGSDGFGFGRNISKSSIDMALRHMDVKRGSMTGNFRPLVTKVPAASVYSVRSAGTRRKRPVSSSGSSESSVNILFLDGSDDNLSERSYS